MNDPKMAPPPEGGGSSTNDPLTLHASPAHPSLRLGAEIVTHAVIRIGTAPRPPDARRPRLSAVLVLDVSGSMVGEPVAQVIHSARRVAEILDDDDRLGVVAFSSAAETVAPLRPLGEGRSALLAELPRMEAEGGTNIEAGLALGALLFPTRAPGERQVVVLMSDGEPTWGARTATVLGATARALKERDIATSTLGYGAKHNDEMLGAIAEGGGGRYAFVIDPKLAEGSFVRALGAQLDVVAERVELLLTPGEGVEIVRVLDDPRTAVAAGGLKVMLPDVILGDELHVVVEMRVRTPREKGRLRALTVKLSGGEAGTLRPFRVAQQVEMACVEAGSFDPDPAAYAVVVVSRVAEARAAARALADRGSYADAQAQLEAAKALIAAAPGFVRGDGSALADAYEVLVDDIAVMAKHPDRADYEVYKRAATDHAGLATSGPRARSSNHLTEAPPSGRMLLDRARAGSVMPRAHLRVITGPRAGLRVAITKPRFVIGRAKSSTDLTLPDVDVSRHHSMIELVGSSFWLVDLGSTSGPIFKGARVARHELSPGDEFLVGESLIRYEVDEPAVLN